MRGVCSSCEQVVEMEQEVIPGAEGFLEFAMSQDDVEMCYHWVLESHTYCGGEPCSGSGMYPEAIIEEVA